MLTLPVFRMGMDDASFRELWEHDCPRSCGDVWRNLDRPLPRVAAPAAHCQGPSTVQHVKRASMPTRWCEIQACCQGDLYDRRLALPAPQPHHGTPGEPVQVLHGLDAHADTRVASGGQKELASMGMGTVRGLTAPVYCLIKLM